MKLSPHFSLEEFLVSETAERLGIDNEPTEDHLDNLRALASTMEDVRELLGGRPITITSGYRSANLNRMVNGSTGSAHLDGLAADFICPAFGTPLQICRTVARSGLPYDQIIHEFGRWVHLSIDPRMRRQVLTIDRSGARSGLLEVRP